VDDTLRYLLANVPTAAFALVAVWAFATGRVHSSFEMKRALQDLAIERDAHDKTREALAIANARAEAGIRAAQVVAGAVEGARYAPPQAPT